MSSRSVQYTSSPLLASKTPIWRSQFIVAFIALGFLGLVVRAAYVQVIDNAFFKRQGTVRFVRTLDLPANRGRILDRNGHILASSVPVPSIWASPEDLERDPAKLKTLAKLLNMSAVELDKKLADEDKNFVWLKRQVDDVHGDVLGDARKRTVGLGTEMGSDPRFGSGGLCQTVRPLFCWGSRQSEPQVREPKRNGCSQRCYWETLGPRPPEYVSRQEGPIQFQWVRR